MKALIGTVLGLLAVGVAQAQEAQVVRVTPAMQDRAQSFDKADTNHDGVLSRAEFAATPRAMPPADAAIAFVVSDQNKDGVVSRAEFLDPNYGTLLKAALTPKP
jgi:hypothetical protein